MSKSRAFACWIGAAFVSAAPAQAQELSARESEIELAGYADCVVSRKAYRKPVTAFLRTVPGSPAFFPAGMKAADMTCLNAAAVRRRAAKLEMKLQPSTFREALYPALYRRDFGRTGPPGGIAALVPLSLAPEFANDPIGLPEDYRPKRALGDCVSRQAPQAVHGMLLAKPYSAAEDAAAKSLEPALGACLPTGQTFEFSRSSLRALLGEAMYKLAVAAEPMS